MSTLFAQSQLSLSSQSFIEKYPHHSKSPPWSRSSGPATSHHHLSSFPKISLPSYNHSSASRSRRSSFKSWLRLKPSRWFVKERFLYLASSWNGMPVWKCSRVASISVLLIWSIYCTIRYFMSLTVYDHDHVRTRVATFLGTISSLATLFFGLETCMVYALAIHLYIDTRFRTYIHFLASFASFLTLLPAIVNILVIVEWRRPKSLEDFDRAIQGRCNWDVDAVWTGTGMQCISGHGASTLGEWMGAGIVRLLVEIAVVCLYFFVSKRFPRPEEEPMPLPAEAGSQMDELTTDIDVFYPSAVEDSKDQFVYRRDTHPFLGAAQVLYGSDSSESYDSEEEETSDSGDIDSKSVYRRVLSDEPDRLVQSLSLSRFPPRSSLERSNSKGSSLLGPRPKPSSPGTSSKSSIL